MRARPQGNKNLEVAEDVVVNILIKGDKLCIVTLVVTTQDESAPVLI